VETGCGSISACYAPTFDCTSYVASLCVGQQMVGPNAADAATVASHPDFNTNRGCDSAI
jgi:hypothetical protein